MIEVTVLNHLKSKITDVPVYLEVPKDASVPYVVIERTGGGKHDHISTAQFAIQSYSDRMVNAAKLNERVKDAMDSLIEESTVSRSALNSDYNFTDTSTKNYRYQAYYELVYKEA